MEAARSQTPVEPELFMKVEGQDGHKHLVGLGDVVVTFGSGGCVAYYTYSSGLEGLHWSEVALETGALLVALGARIEIGEEEARSIDGRRTA